MTEIKDCKHLVKYDMLMLWVSSIVTKEKINLPDGISCDFALIAFLGNNKNVTIRGMITIK